MIIQDELEIKLLEGLQYDSMNDGAIHARQMQEFQRRKKKEFLNKNWFMVIK